jgi:hypothetical protein
MEVSMKWAEFFKKLWEIVKGLGRLIGKDIVVEILKEVLKMLL